MSRPALVVTSRRERLANRLARAGASMLSRGAHYLRGEGIDDFRRNGELRLLRHVLAASDGEPVLFDIGANVGRWSLEAAALKPSAAIHAFEPHPAVYAELVSALEPLANARTHNFALGAEPSTADLHFDPNLSPLSSLHDRDLRAFGVRLGETVTVEVKTIDDVRAELGLELIDFMKVDVEGHERDALRGASQTLDGEFARVVQFEYGGTYLDAGVRLSDVLGLFPDRYQVSRLVPWGLMPVTDEDLRDETFTLSNYAAVLKP